MKDAHPGDEQLLLGIEGELASREKQRLLRHLEECWQCRARSRELETAIADFTRAREREFASRIPQADGPRALLKARLSDSQGGAARPADWLLPHRWMVWAASSAAFLTLCLFLAFPPGPRRAQPGISVPNRRLTPGATVLASRGDVCAQQSLNNKAVPATVRRQVFAEYGIAGADPRAYEVDYLVTPALGGADDIHNLWPHSYRATIWNARVKDALEDQLRQMVCRGDLDLTEAQQEIAANWIVAYKKYFHTQEPLPEHSREYR